MTQEILRDAALTSLKKLRDCAGQRQTLGLPDDVIVDFAGRDPRLQRAIDDAALVVDELAATAPEVLDLDEPEQVAWCQGGLLNFYPLDGVNPYVSAGAKGPWIVTLKGAVLYDTGGYGMLGWGHNPDFVVEEMAREYPMANVMTAHPSQRRFTDALRREIGHTRGGCPYDAFMALNSGSESMSLATRIADTLSGRVTGPGGPREGATIKRLVQRGAFHGRTERPAMLSDSTRDTYAEHLASFVEEDSVLVVEPGDVAALEAAFAEAEDKGWFIELVAMEPVMGEGNPGYLVPGEFYAAARRLTREHGSLLLVDSIQAGLRAAGVLSAVDYPEYADLDAPDLETYSKAINAGQFPLSVLALGPRAVEVFQRGTYGNTMTGNPRAMSVGAVVLDSLTDQLRANICQRGGDVVQAFGALREEFPEQAVDVQGTGLLISLEVEGHLVYGVDSLEEWLRCHGLGVIHGGKSSLRFTPVFDIGDDEIALVVSLVRSALAAGAGRRTA